MAAMGIYAITHIATGRQYIGSAVDIKSRWRIHRCELSKRRHHNIKLQNAWNKYGADAFAFTVLESVPHAADLIPAEQRWLDEVRPHYNVLPKAGSILGSKRSPSTIAKMRIAAANQVHQRGYKPSPETLARLRAAHQGKPVSAAARLKQSHTCLRLLDVGVQAKMAGIAEPVLGAKELAALTGFTVGNIFKLIRDGTIPATKAGRVWAIRRADCDVILPTLRERRQHRQCRAFQGEHHYEARLTAADVLAIRACYAAGGITVAALARQYGVNNGTMWCAVHRRTWKHI